MARSVSAVDDILDRYAMEVHEAYRDDFSALRGAAHDLAEQDRTPAGMRAALDKTAAYMANQDRPYTALEEEYGVGTSGIHLWIRDLHDRAGIEMAFNGHPRKILAAAADEAADLVERERLGKMEAARRVAPRHGVNPGSVKRAVPGDGHSPYATDGTTQELYEAVSRRPHTTAELRERFAPASTPGNYLRRRGDVHPLDHVYPGTNERTVVWYRDGSRDTAAAMLAALRARAGTDPVHSLPAFLDTVRTHLTAYDVPVRDDWDWHWLWADAAIRDLAGERPQHFGPATGALPGVTDYLLDFDDEPALGTRTHFDADDVVAFLDGRTDGSSHKISHILGVLEDHDVVEGVGGKPRKFDSRTIDEPGLLVANVIVARYGGNAFIPAAREP